VSDGSGSDSDRDDCDQRASAGSATDWIAARASQKLAFEAGYATREEYGSLAPSPREAFEAWWRWRQVREGVGGSKAPHGPTAEDAP
jgi:hypothetical protein